MARDKAIFLAFNDFNTKNINDGDDISLSVVAFGIVHLDNGQFKDVVRVPTLSCNILLVYQITHLGEGKTVDFSPHQFVIKDLKGPRHVLATIIIDDIIRLYKFDNFGPSSLPLVFVAHNDEVRNLWHARFNHLNYFSLQTLCKEKILTCLAMVSCMDGVCSGCVLKKHHHDNFDKCSSWHASAPLQLVHNDFCGDLLAVSFFGFKYFLTFIDD